MRAPAIVSLAVAAVLAAIALPAAAQQPGGPPNIPPRVAPPPPPRIILPQVVPEPLRNRPERTIPQSGPERSATPDEPEQPQVQRPRLSRATPQAPDLPPPMPRARPFPLTETIPLPADRPDIASLDQQSREPDIVLVAVDGASDPAVGDDIAGANGLEILQQTGIALLDRRLYRLRIPDGRSIEEVLAGLGGDARIVLSQPSLIFTIQDALPASAASAMQYASTRLGLADVHRLSLGRGVRVAVIDTGIDAAHEALSRASLRQSTVTGASSPTPADHGTEIAGAIVSQGALLGVAPAVDLVGIEAFAPPSPDAPPQATSYSLAMALDVAHAEGAAIVNMSFAGGHDPLMAELLDELDALNVVLVAAAGNAGPQAAPAFPGSHPATIAVTATDHRDGLFTCANQGGYVTLAAPGVDVIAPAAGNRYRLTSGTSIAAAHVTGAIALLLERTPTLTPAEIRAILTATAHDLGPAGIDPEFGAGLVNPLAALSGTPPGQIAIPAAAQ